MENHCFEICKLTSLKHLLVTFIANEFFGKNMPNFKQKIWQTWQKWSLLTGFYDIWDRIQVVAGRVVDKWSLFRSEVGLELKLFGRDSRVVVVDRWSLAQV